uniref:Uncharacterized protein n=1 Tax=Oryza brachyantha TaxID=4533 RepID=J3KYN7_ORYBR
MQMKVGVWCAGQYEGATPTCLIAWSVAGVEETTPTSNAEGHGGNDADEQGNMEEWHECE